MHSCWLPISSAAQMSYAEHGTNTRHCQWECAVLVPCSQHDHRHLQGHFQRLRLVAAADATATWDFFFGRANSRPAAPSLRSWLWSDSAKPGECMGVHGMDMLFVVHRSSFAIVEHSIWLLSLLHVFHAPRSFRQEASSTCLAQLLRGWGKLGQLPCCW